MREKDYARRGRESELHLLLKRVVIESLRRFPCVIVPEYAGCDISVNWRGKWLAFEVETTMSNVLRNLARNESSGFSRQWVIAPNQKVKEMIRRQVDRSKIAVGIPFEIIGVNEVPEIEL